MNTELVGKYFPISRGKWGQRQSMLKKDRSATVQFPLLSSSPPPPQYVPHDLSTMQTSIVDGKFESQSMSHLICLTEGKDLISTVGGAKIFFNNKTADVDNHIQSKRNILFSTLNMKRCLIVRKEMELQGQIFLFLKSSESQVIGLIIFWC